MKKLILFFGILLSVMTMAQTKKGSYVLETSMMSSVSGSSATNTGFGFSSVTENGPKKVSVGLDGGYFVADNLAVKAGLGYSSSWYRNVTGVDTWVFRVGGEYYINGKIPVEVSYLGTSKTNTINDPSYLTTQVGYALFLSENIGVKPLVRYDFALTDNYRDVVSVGVGFGLYF